MFAIIFLTLIVTILNVNLTTPEPMCKDVVWPKLSLEAHRGGRGLAPENTIPAMLKALNLNITTLEMDCYISADHQVIVTHDPKINPLFSLDESGNEIDQDKAQSLILYKMNYPEIRKFDVGSRFYQKFPKQEKLKAYIPLLAELVDSVQLSIKRSRRTQVFYNIEIKSSQEGDGELHPKPEEFVRLLMNVVKEKGIAQWVIIQSFDPRVLEEIHKSYPGVKTSFLTSEGTLEENMRRLSFTPDTYSPSFKLVNPDLISECHKQGMKIIPWTVNEKDQIRKLISLGVDGIISDYPDFF